MLAAIPFPDISPEIFSIPLFGMEFALRWYALAYIVGILIGWRIVVAAVKRPGLWPPRGAPLTPDQVEDLLTWVILGVILGGRLGYVLFYKFSYYLQNPLEIFQVWQGGMAFHGGFLGVVVAVWWTCRKYKAPLGDVANLLALATPPALLLGRTANFINAELYGRATDAPWGVKFPTMCFDPVRQGCPVAGEWFYTGAEVARHPSQLYEAGMEGLILGALLLVLAFGRGWLKRPWSLTGVFLAGYGIARFIVEFFRQPDPQFVSEGNPVGLAFHVNGYGLTMGQTLSLPMILIGLGLLIWSARSARAAPA